MGLEEFLLLREPELEALGVVRVGDRKKLLAAQGEIHRKDWERGSLPRLQQSARREGLMVTAVDAAGMLANIGQHGRLMRANIAYMRLQLEEHGERLLAVGEDLVSARQLEDHCRAAVAGLGLVHREARLLERELEGRQGLRQGVRGGRLLLFLGIGAAVVVLLRTVGRGKG